MPLSRHLLSTAALIALLSSPAISHTWIEEMQVIGGNGSYIGSSGFSRGYMARTDPGFNGESNLWLLPALEARNADQTVRNHLDGSDLLCHPSQRTSNYTNTQYPMLKASPGSYVAMKYLENGHVTLPWTLGGKPENGGTVSIFGTTQPKDQEKILDVMAWTEDSKGGDGRGFLMGTMDYDDGECHQINTCWVSAERQIVFPNDIPDQNGAQAERWCESDVKIPDSVAPGKLTVYWIWDWSTEAGKDCLAPDGKDQFYTNCADMEIVADGGNSAAGMAKIAAESSAPKLEQTDPNTQAVKNYASRSAVNKRKMTTAAANNKAAATPSAGVQNSAWSASCQTSILSAQSAAAANPNSLPPLCPPGSYAPTGAEYTAWSASVKAKATNTPANSPVAESTGAAPVTSTPAATSAAAASSSAPTPAAPAPAPSQSDAGSEAGAVVTVTETQTTISTVTTYAATAPAASDPAAAAPAAAPAATAPAPPAANAQAANTPAADGFPVVSVINDPSAGTTAAAAPSPVGGASHRQHARAFKAIARATWERI